MCLLGIVYRMLPECPILVAANREEAYARPTVPPGIMREASGGIGWLGGCDLQAGGTWMGINARGLLVAITNRPRQDVLPHPRSRGLLCRDLLACRDTAAALGALEEALNRDSYAGFNLVIADRESAVVFEAGDERRGVPLSPGIHLLANGHLNDPEDRRMRRVRDILEQGSATDWMTCVERCKELCRLHGTENAPPICLHGHDGGTVSSTVLALPDDPGRSVYWYAPGPPCTRAYGDLSDLLRKLLA